MTAQTVTGAVARREAGPVNVMWDRSTHFKAILPAHIDVRSFLGTAAAALYGNDMLMKAAEQSPDSLITALMRCAALGHQPGTDEYYLTPRPVKGRLTVLGIEGYRGIIERMYRSGAVKSVIVREVCALDGFSYTEGEMDKPVHSFGGTGTLGTGADFFGATGSRNRGAMVGAYGYAILTTGAVSRVCILTRDDWEAARDAGGWKPDDQYSPWNRMDGGKDHPEFQGRSMVWKTVARRLEPWVPTSAEYRREQLRAAAAASDRSSPAPAGGNGQAAPVYDAEVVEDPQNVPSAGSATPPAHAASPVPHPAEGTHHPGPAPSGHPAADEAAAGPGPAERASSGQRSILGKHLDRLGIEDEEERLGILTLLAGRQIDGTGELTPGEAKDADGRLKACKDRAALIALVHAGEVPGSDG
jgi:recombination protein RecT